MKRKERKVRKHLYLSESTVRFLAKQSKRYSASLGDVVDELVKEETRRR